MTQLNAMTKLEQVENHLRGELQNGRWATGERLPTEHELMSELGIGRSTLREAMNALVKDGLVTRKPRDGTRVCELEQGKSIAILAEAKLLEMRLGLVDQVMVRAARQCVSESGYRPALVVGDNSSPEEFKRSTHLFDNHNLGRIAGVLSTVTWLPTDEYLTPLAVPCVVAGGFPPLHKHGVCADFSAVPRLLRNEFARCGWDRYAVMDVNPRNVQLGALHEEGMEIVAAGWHAAGVRERDVLPVPSSRVSYGHAYDIFVEWWGRPDRPGALYIADEGLFEHVGEAIIDHGIRVPEDLCLVTTAIAGFEPHFPVPFPAVVIDYAEVVRRTWRMLRELIECGETDEPVVYLRPELRRLPASPTRRWSDSDVAGARR